jgi:hypothetical protein
VTKAVVVQNKSPIAKSSTVQLEVKCCFHFQGNAKGIFISGAHLGQMGRNILKKGNINQKTSLLNENTVAVFYLLILLSKSKTAAVEIVPVLSIVKPEFSGEMQYCLLEGKEKAKYCRHNGFPGKIPHIPKNQA